MIKKFLYVTLLMLPGATQQAAAQKNKKQKIDIEQARSIMSRFSADEFTNVKVRHLISEETYKKLAQDGWSNIEIVRVIDNFLKTQDASSKALLSYGDFKKYWRPSAIIDANPAPMFPINYSETTAKTQNALRTTFSDIDETYPRIFYTPNDRLNKKRNTGYFRHVACLPAGGRIHWIAVDPKNEKSVRCIPDGDGIWQTDNAGDGFPLWRCITDNIPNRYHRSISNCYALPFDPDDWNHCFAFMSDGKGGSIIYESLNSGDTWTEVKGSSHFSPKRGYAFKDAQGNLKLIGGKGDDSWNINLKISTDKGVTWENIPLSDDLKDLNVAKGKTGQWIQEFGFNQQDRDNILIPTPYSILVLRDGGRKTNGNFKVERLVFNVYDKTGTKLLKQNTSYFPFADYMKENKQAASPMFIEIDPNNPNNMWVSLGNRTSDNKNNDQSAIYKTTDGGKNWITIKDKGVGSGNVYGNEVAWNWLGGFGVNFNNPNKVYGCSMSSAKSNDGGNSWNEFAWYNRMKGIYPDGKIYNVSVSSHNADNHCIISSKSGRVFRGSDGGMFMLDSKINGGEWLNISGNMGQMLFYQITTNEFGNQMLFGNTQDINLQTYRNGRWTPHRGYEGSTAWVSPYGSRAYYPYGETGIANLDYGSWNRAETKADVCTGNWYISREGENPDGSRFSVIKDFGQEAKKLDPISGSHVKEFTLARDNGVCTIFALTDNQTLHKSVNEGSTFTTVKTPTTNKTCIAVNPDNSNELYIGGSQDIMQTTDGGANWTSIKYNLPSNLSKRRILYHEGSGDIYLVCKDDGIFYLKKGSTQWDLWMKGYNPAAFNNAMINYTTQEMIIDDYGRGIWIADLENPCNRYFQNGFKLKELSNVGGSKTIGIDTKWTIPEYQDYTWTVNGQTIDNPYQYLTLNSLKAGDKVSLKLTLREAPDVVTTSEEFVVPETASEELNAKKGRMLTSNGSGRIDLGHVDYFYKDFTLDFWLNAASDGVILANRPVKDEDAKGWLLRLEDGQLKFYYSPDHQISEAPYNETNVGQTKDELNAGAINKNEWTHVAVTEQRDGKIAIYVDGKKRVEKTRILPNYTLNNSIYLSLFADGYERYTLIGSVDQIKIWNKALAAEDIEKDMFSTATPKDAKLVYFNNFNAPTLGEQKETFSKAGMQSRTRAKVSVNVMSLPLGAKNSCKKKISAADNLFADGSEKILAVTNTAKTPTISAFKYIDDIVPEEAPDFNPDYQKICPQSFMIMFEDKANVTSADKATMQFYVDNAEAYNDGSLYCSKTVDGSTIWEKISGLTYNSSTKTIDAEGIAINDINKRQLAIIKQNPAFAVNISNLRNDKTILLSNPTQEFEFEAEVVGGIEEPTTDYSVKFNADNVRMTEPLQFVQGKAKGKFVVDATSLKGFNSTQEITMSGQDNKMMPIKFTLVNKMIDNIKGKTLSLKNAGANFGSAQLFSSLNGKNTMTMMTWIKYDDATTLNSDIPIMFWRGSTKATGIYVWKGELGCHWNDESWSWNVRSGLKIKETGKWAHVAMVADGKSITFYLNGNKKVVSHSGLSALSINDPLMLGQNNSSDAKFTGSFDNVAIWNRALTDNELAYYSENNPDLSDNSLVCFLNNDYKDENNKTAEIISGLPVNSILDTKNNGKVTNNTAYYPYSTEAIAKNNTRISGSEAMTIPRVKLPVYGTNYYVHAFNTVPYNSGIKATEKYVQRAFWTLSFEKTPAFASGKTVNVTFEHPAIVAKDSVNLIIRPLGSLKTYSTRITATATKDKSIEFNIPAENITDDIEMYMAAIQSANRPEKVVLAPKGTTTSNIVLNDGCDSIIVEAKVVGGLPSGSYTMDVAEDYATVKDSNMKFSTSNTTIEKTIIIDRSKINKVGYNPLTITCDGLSIEPLNITFSLEPKVNLKLTNGETANKYVASTPKSDMIIEATIEQGVFDEKVDLELTSDLKVDYAVNSAPIISNNQASLNQLSYSKGTISELENGWNLVGNPYLSTINLTESRNREMSGITRYIYKWDEASKNFKTFDLTSYNSQHTILPFGAFYVQAMNSNAALEIYPNAKEAKVSKALKKSSLAIVNKHITLGLYVDGKEVDQTIVYYEADAREKFLLNEDAVKMMSTDDNANQFFTYTKGDNIAAAINRTTLTENSAITLATDLKHKGEAVIKVIEAVGFGDKDQSTLVDSETGAKWAITTGSEYRFTPSAKTYTNGNGRFEIQTINEITGIDDILADSYNVNVVGNTCTIKGLKDDAKVIIYNTSGMMMSNELVSNGQFSTTLPNGIFFVKIISMGKTYTTKIQVNQSHS